MSPLLEGKQMFAFPLLQQPILNLSLTYLLTKAWLKQRSLLAHTGVPLPASWSHWLCLAPLLSLGCVLAVLHSHPSGDSLSLPLQHLLWLIPTVRTWFHYFGFWKGLFVQRHKFRGKVTAVTLQENFEPSLIHPFLGSEVCIPVLELLPSVMVISQAQR